MKINNTIKYYLYTTFTNLRFSRIISILFVVQVLKLSLVQFALLESIFMFAQFFSEIPSGVLGDLFKNKTVVLTGLAVLITTPLLTVMAMFCPKNIIFPLLAVSFALEGVGNALLSGADEAFFYEGIREDGDEQLYGKIRGNRQLIGSIVLGIATAVGGYLFTQNNKFPYLFQSLFLLGAVAVIALTKESKKFENVDHEHETYTDMLKSILSVFRDMIHSSDVLFLFVIMIIVTAVENAIFMLLPNYISKLGFDASANGSVFMIYSFAGGLVAAQSYRLVKMKFSSLTVLIIAVLLAATGLEIQGSKYLFLLGAGLLYIVLDILDPVVMQMLNLWVSDKSRATFISGLSFSTSLATMIINPVIGAVIQKYGTINMLIAVSLITVMMIVTAYLLIMRTNKNQNEK